MNNEIITAIESAKAEFTANIGRVYGAEMSPAEAMLALRGDFLLSLAYASLFFPRILFDGGRPVARFATSSADVPLDCFHVDLLHHTEAAGRTPTIYSALGATLAGAWNQVLSHQGLPGRFVYDESSGYDVVYEP